MPRKAAGSPPDLLARVGLCRNRATALIMRPAQVRHLRDHHCNRIGRLGGLTRLVTHLNGQIAEGDHHTHALDRIVCSQISWANVRRLQ